MRILIIAMLFLTACGSETEIIIDHPKEVEITRYDIQTSWYELNQHFEGVPKYSGAFGTYTAKHIPVAVKCELGEWASTSNNRDGNISLYAVNLKTGDSVLVHTVEGSVDPHQNAAIQCGGGKLWFAVSARGYKRPGYLYSSADGYTWTRESESFRSYPQLHWVNEGLLTLYTNYLSDPSQPNNVSRTLYSSCNDRKIVPDDAAHYSMSYYDGETLHVVYNDLPNGADSRTNLNYISSKDGCEWSEPELWHSGDFVYLKDINVVDGEVTALVVLSDSYDPTRGERRIAKITSDSTKIVGFTNHNYTTGALSSDGEVIFPRGTTQYAGGEYLDAPYVNYIRRIHGGDGYVASEGISAEYASDAWLIKIE